MEKKAFCSECIKKWMIVLLSVVGFITTIKLAIIYYDSNFNPYALPSFCSINAFIDCDGVAQTTHSQFLGIPLAYWGMFFYLFIIFMVFVENLKRISFLHFLRVFKHPYSYISALGFISFVISMILAGVSLFEIKKICVLCVFTYVLNLLIAIIATNWYKRKNETYTITRGVLAIYKSFKTSVQDFWHAIKVKKYFVAFVSFSLLASAVLSYTTVSYIFTPQVKRYKEIKAFVDMKTNPFKSSGNILGDKDAKLLVYVYTDYRCPICKTYDLMISRAAQELSGLKFIHKNLPLDIECNRRLLRPFHEGSCMLAKYSIAASNQGRMWDLNSEIFEKQPADEDAVLKIAKSLNFDTIKLKQDANSLQTYEKLAKDLDDAAELRLEGTPAIVINGKVYTGIKPYYELKEILMKAGALEKR